MNATGGIQEDPNPLAAACYADRAAQFRVEIVENVRLGTEWMILYATLAQCLLANVARPLVKK